MIWKVLYPVVPEMAKQITTLSDTVATILDDISMLKGFTQVQDRDITELKNKTVNLLARSMSNNILITGILGDSENEDCKVKVLQLLWEHVKLDIEDEDVVVAHRLGKKLKDKTRMMVVRCSHKLREIMFQNTANLKNVKNADGNPYYISPQLPEPLNTEKRERDEHLRAIHKSNALIPDS